MKESQTEIQDDVERSTQHFIGSLTTGSIEIVPSNGNTLQLTKVHVPARGPNGNAPGVILLVSWDGVNYETFPRGTTEFWPGKGYGPNENKVSVKHYNGTATYEIKVLS